MTDNNDSYAPGSNNPSLGICSLESATASLSSTAKTSAFSASDYHRTGMMAFRGTAVGSGSIIPQIMHNRRMQQG
jgi:hypothetical protein